MSAKHTNHRIILDPVDPFSRIHFRPPIRGDEAIALEPPRCHKNKYPERRVAEPKPLGQWLRQTPHQQINFLYVALVHCLQLCGKRLVPASECEKGGRSWKVKETPEGVVPWYAALAIAKDVNGAHIAYNAVRGVEVAKEVGHIMNGDGARVVDTEGEESLCKCDTVVVQRVLCVLEGKVTNGNGRLVSPAWEGEESNVIWRY
jgi:hypothetical protein